MASNLAVVRSPRDAEPEGPAFVLEGPGPLGVVAGSGHAGPLLVGPITLVTEDETVAGKLLIAASRIGAFHSFPAGTVTLEVGAGREDFICRTLSRFLTEAEQEEVFVFLEPGRGPRLLTLRRAVAFSRDAWFGDFMESGTFDCHLQPIVSLPSGEPYGYEALLRASRTDGVVVPPLEAFRAARGTGRLVELDERARLTCLRAGAERLRREDRLFVNVDPDSLPRGLRDFEATLDLARALPLAPSHIVFELTESEGVQGSSALDYLLAAIREEGFLVALDDLESGYSTLGVLEHLRPDIAKLDQRLVRGAHGDRYRARLVKAFADLSRDLGVELIVEGVETCQDREFVCGLGIRLAQGYFFGRPAREPLRNL